MKGLICKQVNADNQQTILLSAQPLLENDGRIFEIIELPQIISQEGKTGKYIWDESEKKVAVEYTDVQKPYSDVMLEKIAALKAENSNLKNQVTSIQEGMATLFETLSEKP